MAERIRKLTNSEVEVLARIIADTMTGSQMNEIFQECGVQDVSKDINIILENFDIFLIL